jgi:hypothetical protein
VFRRRRRAAEASPSGSPVYRHPARERGFTGPAEISAGRRAALDDHLARYLGEDWVVWHEIASDLVHLDVYLWRPTPERPVYTLVTVGISDLPMSLPPELVAQGRSPYAELLISLPADWPMPAEPGDVSPWQDENSYFPMRSLKALGRLPHEYGTWLGFGHTIPNGDPPAPLCDGTALVSWLLLPPVSLPRDFSTVESPDGAIEMLALVGITLDEQDLKLRAGVEALFPGFERHGVTDVLDIGRPSSLRPPRSG